MKQNISVAVTSRSFSKNPILRDALLNRYEHVSFNDQGKQFKKDELIQFLQGHEKAIIALDQIDETILRNLPNLKVISKFGVGLDSIDCEAIKRLGVKLSCTPGVNKRSVAELVIGLAINLLRNILITNEKLKQGIWQPQQGFLLSNRKIGIVGCGNIGREVIQLLKPFSNNIICFDLMPDEKYAREENVEFVSLEVLFKEADVISIHLPLSAQTRYIIQEDLLNVMKPTSILINTSRGGLVDELALKSVLLNKRIAGAAFDVFLKEPPDSFELMKLPNFIATPHLGGSTAETTLAMGFAAIEGLEND